MQTRILPRDFAHEGEQTSVEEISSGGRASGACRGWRPIDGLVGVDRLGVVGLTTERDAGEITDGV